MKTTRRTMIAQTAHSVAALAVMSSVKPPVAARAASTNINPPPFDFSDDFYLKNGVDPVNIKRRPGNPDRAVGDWILDPSNTDPVRRGIRVKETTGGFDKDGKLIYYSIMGDVVPSTFTTDAAGARAKQLAENFRAFLFPKTTRNPDFSIKSVKLSPAPPNRRHDNVFDTRNKYFCDNLLGLWIITFVVYTQNAFITPEGQATLAALALKNGVDLDGTPVLENTAEIDGLVAKGFAEFRFNAEGGPPAGADGPRWVI